MSPVRMDVHHHMLTPEYVEALAAVGIVESAGVPFPAWTPDHSLAMLDRAGVEVAMPSCRSLHPAFLSRTQIGGGRWRAYSMNSGRRRSRAIPSASGCSPRCRCPT